MRSASSSTSTCTERRSKTLLLEVVDQAAGRADQDVHAVLEVAPLLLVVDAAEGEAELQARVLAEQLGVVVDLHRELARRRDDQRERRVDLARRRDLGAEQPGIQGDEEGRRLARAGLGLAGDVVAGKRAGQRLGLDRRAALEARVGDAACQRLGQVKVGK